MSAATILFMDVVGFSRKPTSEQKRLVEALTDTVMQSVRTLLKPPFQHPEVIALPTGDGMALIFLHASARRWSYATISHLINTLQKWAADESTATSDVALRFGIHVGTVEIITDINGNPNVCGDTINYAQRVMDAANPRQVLMSDRAFHEYIGMERTDDRAASSAEGISTRLVGPIQVFAKHALQIPVYKMVRDPADTSLWNNEDPAAKHHMLVSLTSLPKEIGGSFVKRLQKAHSVAFAQLGGTPQTAGAAKLHLQR